MRRNHRSRSDLCRERRHRSQRSRSLRVRSQSGIVRRGSGCVSGTLSDGVRAGLAATLKVTARDERLEPLRKLARRLDVTIVAGAPVDCSQEKPNIGALIFSAFAPVVYAKRFLHFDEEAFFSAGDLGCVVDVKGVTVALAICADTTHPEHAEDAAKNGADVYAAAVFVTSERHAAVTVQLRDYAADHSMAVLMANYGSKSCGMVPAGKSAIWDHTGKLLASASEGGEAIVIAERARGQWRGRTIQP